MVGSTTPESTNTGHLKQLGFDEDSQSSAYWHAALAKAHEKQLSPQGGRYARTKKHISTDSGNNEDVDRDLLAILFYETDQSHGVPRMSRGDLGVFIWTRGPNRRVGQIYP